MSFQGPGETSSTTGEPDALDPRQVLRTLWRRKSVILAVTILGTLLAGLYAYRQDNVYTATAEIILGPQGERVVDTDPSPSDVSMDVEAIQSEIEVLTSRNLAGDVVDELALTRDSAFNPALRSDDGGSLMAWLPDVTAWLPPEVKAAVVSQPDSGPPPSPEEKFAQRKETAVNILLQRLSVQPIERSRVLALSVSGSDPKTAAELANAYADIYIEEQLEAKYQATERATKWLNEKVQNLKAKVEASEKAVARYREDAGLVQSSGESTVTSQQLSELNSKLIMAQTKRAEAEARARQIERLIDRGGIREAAKVLESTLIDQLRSQRAELERQRAELSTEYGEKHPRMVNLRAEIEDVNEQIRAEVEKILQNVRNKVEVARTRERTLEQKVSQLESETASLNTKEVKLRQLKREAEANRALYQRFLSQLKETSAEEGIQKPNARIISQAAVPAVPSAPQRDLILMVAVAGSLAAGVGSAFLIEQFDDAYRSAEQTEAALGLPNLALVPLIRRVGRKTPISKRVVDRPQSAFAEAIRSLHTGILLSDVDTPPRLVAVTSARPREGKTSVATALARSVAAQGQRVLLIDGDLRKPRVHTELGVEKGTGLVELLSDRAAADEAIRRETGSGLSYLLAGSYVPSPQELITSSKMNRLLADVRERFDLVVLDTPPILAVSDTLLLGRQADRTVLAIQWGESRRESVQEAVKKLREAGVALAGTVLSMVDVRKHSKYSYADSGYYYGRYAGYYSD